MDLLNVALQIIAIIAIIAVGAFIIVFLSDLLISIIDDHQGIFFRRNKGKQEQYDKTTVYTANNTKTNTVSNMAQKNFEFDDEPKREEIKKEPVNPFKKSNIDLEAAKREQEMIEKANKSFFDEEETTEKEETPEEIAQKERIARLEERNRQLENELKQKEAPKAQTEPKKETPKFEPKFAEMPKETPNDDESEEDEMEVYEKLIKQINNEVKTDMEGTSKNPVKQDVEKKNIKMSLFEDINEDEEDEEDEEFEEEEKEDKQYKSLTEELAALKLQLEQEKQEREKLKLEAEERTQKIIEEKQKLEEALNAKKVEETEHKKGANVILDSEEEYLARLEILEERLKEAKKQLRHNKREFVPLNKIKRTLEKDEVKLRRKEAQVAKQKVLLFGVNNSEIDVKKQAELEQEIDMLEGLKLSVQHCEDVMRENADRYPVLEQTHQILTKNVRNLNADIESINEKLKELRKKKE